MKGIKAYLLRVIDTARNRKDWGILGYRPDPKHIVYALNGFEHLIQRMTIDDVDEGVLEGWIKDTEAKDPIRCGFPKCDKHQLLLSYLGCKLCNEGG